MGERIIVWGAGGHGRAVADVARACGHQVIGFIDRDPGRIGTPVGGSGVTVVTSEDEFFSGGDQARWHGISVALGMGDNRTRLACLARLGERRVPTLAHPSAIISPSANIGRGSAIFPLAVVNADARIDDAVIVNSGAVIEHDCVLESGVHVSPGAVLAGGVVVRTTAWIGAGATLIPGTSVGEGSIVGAGSVVVRPVPDGVVVFGTPARLARHLS